MGRNTLSDHTDDRRQSYTFEEIEAAETEDEVWNAAQRQLKRRASSTTTSGCYGGSVSRVGSIPAMLRIG